MTSADPARVPRAGCGRVSRADALRVYFELGAEGVAGPAAALGFIWREPESAVPVDGADRPSAAQTRTASRTASASARPMSDGAVTATPQEPLTWWRPIRVNRPELSTRDEPPPDPEAERPFEAYELAASGPPPAAPPIVAPARLRCRLDASLRTRRLSREVDVDRLADRLARGESIGELPRRQGLTQARLVLVFDPSPRLTPFWDDQLDVAVSLVRRLGPDRVRQLPPPDGTRAPRRRLQVAPDEIVLAMTDLGFYGEAETSERWVRLGRHLQAAGARLRALVPCPAWRWRGPGARLWNAIDWSHPEGVGRRKRPKVLVGAPVDDPAEVLLRLLAPALRVEPGLLRLLRRLLGTSADLGTEVEVWNHPDADGRSSRSLGIDPRRRLELLAEPLTHGWDPDLVAEAARTLIAWHRSRADLVWASELAHLRACGVPDSVWEAVLPGVDLVAVAERTFARATATAASLDPGRQHLAEGTRSYWRRESGRVPASLASDSRFGRAWVRAVKALRRSDPAAPPPPGVTPDMLQVEDDDLQLRRFAVWQSADQLLFRPAGSATSGSLLVSFSARTGVLTVGDGVQPPRELDLDGGPVEIPCPSPVGCLELVTDVDAVVFEAWSLPEWASGAGRDGYGLWVSFAVDGVEQRLLWMSPGSFLMGSPETEAGRWEVEGSRHEVTLSEGFWLGETPCPKPLWEAVMGENPSRFQSPDRPVEQVSWHDCHEFFERLEMVIPGFKGRLPTEAQWEYACRAGTESATWVGDLEILGERSAPRLDAIAWYGGNSGVDFDLADGHDSSKWVEKQYPHTRAGMRPIGMKRPNPWGLQEMLGNVFEWCEDHWDAQAGYDNQARVDPLGTDGAERVIRGGSWGVLARFVRAAYRLGLPPGGRIRNLGFRLSRGPRVISRAEPN